MKSSNLAERLEEFAAVIDSLRLTGERVARVPVDRLVAEGQAVDRILKEDTEAMPARRARRARTRGIQVRDQGLRAFRVR